MVADLVREIGASKNPQMAVVTTRDEAALVIEVVGRLQRAMNLSSPTDKTRMRYNNDSEATGEDKTLGKHSDYGHQ